MSQSSLYPALKFGDGSVGLEIKAPLRCRCLLAPLTELDRDGKASDDAAVEDVRVLIGSSRSISLTDMSEHCGLATNMVGVVGSSSSIGDGREVAVWVKMLRGMLIEACVRKSAGDEKMLVCIGAIVGRWGVKEC